MKHSSPLPDHYRCTTFLSHLADQIGLGCSPDRYTRACEDMHELGLLGSAGPYAFLETLHGNEALRDDFVRRLVVPETYFFRHKLHFDLLADRIVPELRAKRPIRIWSAGCATGEEPYSLAILCHQLGLGDQVSIIATDISAASLDIARTGIYRRWSLRAIDDWPAAHRFFDEREPGFFTLDPQIRHMVHFRRHNLVTGSYDFAGDEGFDVILCRNVLLYMEPDALAAISVKMFGALANTGYLIVGPADPPLALGHAGRSQLSPYGLYYRHAGDEPSPSLAIPLLPAEPTLRPVLRRSVPTAPEPKTPARPKPVPAKAQATPMAANDDTLQGELRDLMNRGQIADMRAFLDAALERSIQPEGLLYMAALFLWQRGDLAEALTCLGRVLYLTPDNPAVHLTQGLVLAKSGNLSRARNSFRHAYRLAVASDSDRIVPLADGDTAGQVARAARYQLDRIGHQDRGRVT